MSTHTLGSDPELFVVDMIRKRVVSSIPVLKNDKHTPLPLGDGINLYADNVLAELSFPPSSTGSEVVAKLRTAFRRSQAKMGKRYRLLPKSSHVFEKSQLNVPQATEVGCNPNYDAYERKENEPKPFEGGLRSGSFHIHIGSKLFDGPKFEEKAMNRRVEAVKLLDVFVGCASIVFDRDETSLERRKLYGKAGEFRPTPYGLEYRVLGNYALRSPQLTRLVFDLVDFTMGQIEQGKAKDIVDSLDEDNIRDAINTNNRGLAACVLGTAALPKHLIERVTQEYNPQFSKDWNLV